MNATPAPAKQRPYSAIVSGGLILASLPALLAGLIAAVSLGYTLGPVLTGRQRVAVIAGAFVASLPAQMGTWLGFRARRLEQTGGTAVLSANAVILVLVWLGAIVALLV